MTISDVQKTSLTEEKCGGRSESGVRRKISSITDLQISLDHPYHIYYLAFGQL